MLKTQLRSVCLLIVLLFISLTSISAFACCSLDIAEFTNTIGFISEMEKDGKRVHLLGYENTAQNIAISGNALFLPIPAVPGTMSNKNIVDTSSVPNFMDEMQTTVTKPIIDPLVAVIAVVVLVLGLCVPFRAKIIGTLKQSLPWTGGIGIMILLMLIGLLIGVVSTSLVPSEPVPSTPVANSPTSSTQTPVAPMPTALPGDGIIHGVDTAGTVRVNNLANMERVLNIATNTTQLGSLICGAAFILFSFVKKNLRIRRIALGVQLIVMGLVFPGIINWIIASPRDANLFDGPMVFNSGIYTVVLAADAAQIPGVIDRVPASKRPKLNPEIFNAYSKWYKGWTFALCCFDNRDAQKATPMLWWYEPQHPELMFFPALDAHNGKPPILDTKVQVDHCLVVASDKAAGWQDPAHWLQSPWRSFQYPKDNPLAKTYMPDRLMGQTRHGYEPQGDFIFRTEDVRRGVFEPQRALPPGVGGDLSLWNQSFPAKR